MRDQGRVLRLELWLVRVLLVAGALFSVFDGYAVRGLAALASLGLSFVPGLIGRGTRARVPRLVEVAAVLAVALPGLATAFGLYERVLYWGKLVHAVDAFLVVFVLGLLLLGARDRERIELPDQLAALLTMFAGLFFGILWETVEFVLDWVLGTDIQKSNSDTMTDFLWNDVATVAGALVAMRLYRHVLGAGERDDLGRVGAWLTDGPSRVLDRHGLRVGVLVAVLMAAALVGLWFAGRPMPNFPR